MSAKPLMTQSKKGKTRTFYIFFFNFQAQKWIWVMAVLKVQRTRYK